MLLHEHTRDEVEGEKKNGLRKRAKLHPRAPATTPTPPPPKSMWDLPKKKRVKRIKCM